MDNYRAERLTTQGIVIEVRYDRTGLRLTMKSTAILSPILK
jgi:hypothetical protein